MSDKTTDELLAAVPLFAGLSRSDRRHVGNLATRVSVPAGATFDFALTVRIHDGEDLLTTIYEGLKLLELTGLGGSGSRGYGKVKFAALKLDGVDVSPDFDGVDEGEFCDSTTEEQAKEACAQTVGEFVTWYTESKAEG